MGEFDELVAHDGVLMVGRIGPDGRVAEHKSSTWYIEDPASEQMAQGFCSAIATLLNSMVYAIDAVSQTAFSQTSWQPVKSWAVTGGDYSVVVRGDRFMICERAKIGSLDELSRLMGNEPA